MEEDKQLEKLSKVLDILETDRASTDDVAGVFEVVIDVIKDLKGVIDRDMARNKGEMDDLYSGVLKELKIIETRIVKVSDRFEDKLDLNSKKIQEQLLGEIESVKGLIPQLPDLSVLSNKIAAVEKKIPKIPQIPESVSSKEVTKMLATLKSEVQKDIKKTKKTSLFGVGPQAVWNNGDGGVLSKLTVSATEPENPAINDLWVDTS